MTPINPLLNPLLKLRQLAGRTATPAAEAPLEEIPENQEASFIGKAGNALTTGIETIGNVLDTPQDWLYGGILGKNANEVGNRDDEIDGREILRELGILRRTGRDNWGNFAAGLATDLVVDPLNLINVGALTKAGKAVQKAGAGARAGEYLTKGVARGADLSAPLVERARSGAAKAGKALEQVSDVELTGRPFIRPRAAFRYGTVSDLEKAAAAGVDVPNMERLSSLPENLKNTALQKDIGIGIGPFQAKFNVPGGGLLTDLIDSTVAGAKFGKAGQTVRSFFDKDVAGASSLGDQTYLSGAAQLARDAVAKKEADAVSEIAKLRVADDAWAKKKEQAAGWLESSTDSREQPLLKMMADTPTVFSEEGNRALGRLIEKPIAMPKGQSVADGMFKKLSGGVEQYLRWWDEASKSALDESRKLGVGAKEFSDPNISGYLPRSMSNLLQDSIMQRHGKDQGRKLIGTMTADQLSRSAETMVPGGRDFLAFELAKDPYLVGPKRLAKTDDEAAEYIQKKFDELTTKANVDNVAMAKNERKQLAHLLNSLPEEVLEEGAPSLFGQHPTDSIRNYVTGRARANRNAESQLDMLASYAEEGLGTAGQGVTKNAVQALQEVGLKTGDDYGAKEFLRNAIAKKRGIDPDKVELTAWNIPVDIISRLQQTAKLANFGPQERTWWKYISDIWRNSILSWPSRYARDLMGGLSMNMLEVENPMNLARGYRFSWSMIVHGKSADDLAATIVKMPQYAGLDASEAAARYYGDLAATGLIEGTKKREVSAGAALTNALPGYSTRAGDNSAMQLLNPMSWGGIVSPDSKYAKAGAALGETTDQITRVAGYTALMLEGNSPQEAARLMKRAHVDYDSLSDWEKEVRDRVVPFYTFSSRMAGETSRRLVENPQQMNRLLRLTQAPSQYNTDDAYIPEYARERTVLSSWKNADGNQNVLYNLDIPLLGSLRQLGDSANGGFWQEAGGMLNPTLKMFMENITGTDSFTRQPLEAKRGTLARALGVGRDSPLHDFMQYADRAVEMSPFVRQAQLAKDLLENRDQLPTSDVAARTAVNALTGIKMRTLDTDDMIYDVKRNLADELGSNLREYKVQYVPKELLPSLPERDQRNYRNFRQLEKMRADRRKRAEAGLATGLRNPG